MCFFSCRMTVHVQMHLIFSHQRLHAESHAEYQNYFHEQYFRSEIMNTQVCNFRYEELLACIIESAPKFVFVYAWNLLAITNGIIFLCISFGGQP